MRHIEDQQIQVDGSFPETRIPQIISGDLFTDPVPGLDTTWNALIITISAARTARKEQTGLKL